MIRICLCPLRKQLELFDFCINVTPPNQVRALTLCTQNQIVFVGMSPISIEDPFQYRSANHEQRIRVDTLNYVFQMDTFFG